MKMRIVTSPKNPLDYKMDPEGSRYMIVDYINYRLDKTGHKWNSCPPLLPNPTRVHRMMRTLGDEFEKRYRSKFSELANQLHITQDSAYPTFSAVVEEIFAGGVNWGRVVALFAFSGTLAIRCIENNLPQVVDLLVDWVSTYMHHNIDQWITDHNGWDGFVEFYENGPSDRNDSHWDSFSGVIKYGVIGAIGAMALGAILTQRT